MAKLSETLQDVKLVERSSNAPVVSMEVSVLYLSTKDFNKNCAEILSEMVFEQDDLPNSSLHRLLFSGKEKLKELLNIECKYLKLPTGQSAYLLCLMIKNQTQSKT